MTLNDDGAMASSYLPPGLPAPNTDEPLVAPYYQALQRGALAIQRCAGCREWQFGPEWICHRCHSFDLSWEEVIPRGTIYSWERVWHPVHPCLASHGPYLIVLVELADISHVRLLGNLLGDPLAEVRIGAPVEGCFEQHGQGDQSYTLLQWKTL